MSKEFKVCKEDLITKAIRRRYYIVTANSQQEAEQIVDKAQPLFTEIHEDLTELNDVVHEKATIYKGLFNELKHSIK